jgi:N-acetylglutamate synthase-like GNAT family acetyltransferase
LAGARVSSLFADPAYFLAMHSIELSLKAFMRLRGVTVHELRSRKYGHGIRACYRKAKELGLREHFKCAPTTCARC